VFCLSAMVMAVLMAMGWWMQTAMPKRRETMMMMMTMRLAHKLRAVFSLFL